MAVLNSVEPAAVASGKKEFMVTSWEGKEMDRLLEDFQRKFEPSQQHIKSVRNFQGGRKSCFKM